MAKKKSRDRIQVGDRVRLRIAALVIDADVIEDRGDIDIDGGQVVHIRFLDEAGEVERMDWPAKDVTVIRRRRTA